MIDRMSFLTERLESSGPTGGTAERRGVDRHTRQGNFGDLIEGAAQQNEEPTQTREPVRPAIISRVWHRNATVSHPSSTTREEVAAEPNTGVEIPATDEPATGETAGTTGTPRPVAASANGYVRSSSVIAPQLVRFAQVPDSAQYPDGPYHQAPAEFGGEWWYVSPFTGSEPWTNLTGPVTPPGAGANSEPLPIGFEQAFGARPQRADYANHSQFRTAVVQWEQDLGYFQQSGVPDGFDQSQVDAATAQFEAWGMGKPVFYEGRYDWQVRFPDSQLPNFDTTAWTALTVPHIVIAEFQVKSVQEGLKAGPIHPFLPEHLRPADA